MNSVEEAGKKDTYKNFQVFLKNNDNKKNYSQKKVKYNSGKTKCSTLIKPTAFPVVCLLHGSQYE